MKSHQIKDYLRKNYPIIGKIKKISKISHTDINSKNFFILTSKGTFVLKITGKNKPKQLTQVCKILNYCQKNKIPVLKPIQNKQKNIVVFF